MTDIERNIIERLNADIARANRRIEENAQVGFLSNVEVWELLRRKAIAEKRRLLEHLGLSTEYAATPEVIC